MGVASVLICVSWFVVSVIGSKRLIGFGVGGVDRKGKINSIKPIYEGSLSELSFVLPVPMDSPGVLPADIDPLVGFALG